MENWCFKYEPKNVEDLYGKRKPLDELVNILKAEPCATVVIVGSGGIGKTVMVKLALMNILGFNIEKYDSITYKNDRLLDKIVNINKNNLLQRLKTNSPLASTPTALLIDNLDTVCLSSEKTVIDSIVTTNIKSKLFPLIMTVSDNSSKLVDDIKGLTHIIRVDIPTENDVKDLLYNVSSQESMNISEQVIDALASYVKGDMRLLMNIIQDLNMCFPDTEITMDMYCSFMENNTKQKNLDLHLFDSFKLLVKSKGDICKTLSIYNNDKVLLPLILQENFYKELSFRKLNVSQKNAVAKTVSEFISQGDIIETYIYTDQNWHLQEFHCFTSCTYPIYDIESVSPYVREGDYSINFSSELNKTSLKNINRKNIAILCSSSRINMQDIHEMSSLMNELIRQEQFDTVRSLAEAYGDDPLRFIETIIKVNKCNSSVVTLNTKAKKLIGIPSANKDTLSCCV